MPMTLIKTPAIYEVTTATKLVVRVLQDLVAQATFTDYSDLAESLKCRCAQLKIPYGATLVSDAINQLEQGGKTPLISPLRPVPVRHVEQIDDGPRLSHTDAVDILARLTAKLDATPALKDMPTVYLTVREADRRRAMAIVEQELLESLRRCEALERTLKDEG